MWYSLMSTGVTELDHQHANIDSIIMLYERAQNVDQETRWLEMMYFLAQRHFQFEEDYFGDRFPPEHKTQHVLIIEALARKIQQRQNNDISKEDMHEYAYRVFSDHFATYCLKLKTLSPPLESIAFANGG